MYATRRGCPLGRSFFVASASFVFAYCGLHTVLMEIITEMHRTDDARWSVAVAHVAQVPSARSGRSAGALRHRWHADRDVP